MNELPYFNFWVKDWIADERVASMTAEERGAYIHLLAHCWNSDGLDKNNNWARIAGVAALTDKVCFLFSVEVDGKWWNKRLYEERKSLIAFNERQSERGRKGAAAKWANAQAMPKQSPSNAQDMPADGHPYPEPKPKALPEPKPEPKDLKTSSFGLEHSERAELLKSRILGNNPKAKITEADLNRWADTVRLMVERDNRTLEEIDTMIEFSQSDDFWKSNILSMAKLREQFDKLTLKSKPRPTSDDKRRAATLAAGNAFIQKGNPDATM